MSGGEPSSIKRTFLCAARLPFRVSYTNVGVRSCYEPVVFLGTLFKEKIVRPVNLPDDFFKDAEYSMILRKGEVIGSISGIISKIQTSDFR